MKLEHDKYVTIWYSKNWENVYEVHVNWDKL